MTPARPRGGPRHPAAAIGATGVGIAALLLSTGPARLGALTTPRAARPAPRVHVGGNPDRVAVGPNGVWVGDLGRLARVDPATDAVTVVPGATTPIGVGSDVAWAGAYTRPDAVVRIDPATAMIVATVGLDDAPTAVAVGAGAAWVLETTGVLARIDLTSNAVTATLVLNGVRVGPAGTPDGGFGFGLAVTSDAVWVSGRTPDGKPVLWRVDPSTVAVTATIPTGTDCTALATNGSATWAACGTARRLDPTGPRLVDTRADARDGIAVGTDGTYALGLDGTVAHLDASTGRVVSTIAALAGAEGIAAGDGALWLADPRLHDPVTVAGTGALVRVAIAGSTP